MSRDSRQRERAAAFGKMHESDDILVLANAWDVPSARIFEQAGFKAIGTTSAGIAVSRGYADGQNITREEMLSEVTRIVKSVSVPVTADMEAGYGDEVADIAETVEHLIATGAVGLNIEDSTKRPERPFYEIEVQVRRIEAVRQVAESLGIPLVINARTDVFARGGSDKTGRLNEAIERCKAYRKAGADCLFPLGAIDRVTIADIVTQVGGPINILATDGVPPIAELRRIGVKRVSLGSGPMRATLGLTRRIAKELRESGTYSSFLEGAPPLTEANELVAPN